MIGPNKLKFCRTRPRADQTSNIGWTGPNSLSQEPLAAVDPLGQILSDPEGYHPMIYPLRYYHHQPR